MDAEQTVRPDTKSRAVCRAAAALIPGGRHTKCNLWPTGEVGPPVTAKGKGATLTDVDGNEYIDYHCADGALILGHADERVVVAVNKAISKGCDLGSPSEPAVRLAELVASRYAPIDMVQTFSSRVEAVAYAVQLARTHTNRRHIVEFEGSLEGTAHSLRIPYNDLARADDVFREQGETIAAVLAEPVATAYGLVPPAEGFLHGLRERCDSLGALLIFDESVVGFRVASGGAAELFDVVPDLTILGPILGGGLPLAACGGRREVMNATAASVTPDLAIQPSTNVLAIAAGNATLQAIGEDGFHEDLEAKSARLHEGLSAAASAAGVSLLHTRVGSMIGAFFTSDLVRDFASAKRCDTRLSARYFHAMLDQGVFLRPSPWPTMFVSAAHTDEQIERTIEAAHSAMRIMATA